MTKDNTKLILINYEEPKGRNGGIFEGRPAISYKAVIGLEENTVWGLCVSETRARLIDGMYLLEKSEDSQIICGSENRDNRRFSIISEKGIVGDRKEARHILEYHIRKYAERIAIDCGLEIADLIDPKNIRK
jgi:hypothetical protein